MAISQVIVNKFELALNELNCKCYKCNAQNGVFCFTLDTGLSDIPNLEFFISVTEVSVQIYSLLPLQVDTADEGTVTRVREFLCLANKDLQDSKFEYNSQNGTIELNQSPCPMAPEQTEKLYPLLMGKILSLCSTFDAFAPYLLSVVAHGVSAREAIARRSLENDEEIHEN